MPFQFSHELLTVQYYDKEKKQPGNKRRMIGIVNPETGQIEPTVKKVKEPQSNEDFQKLYQKAMKDIGKYQSRISSLEEQVASLSAHDKKLLDQVQRALSALSN